MSKSLSVSDYDPLAKALQPPLDESPKEKIARMAQEEAAKRISSQIDESLKQERQLQKKKSIVRLLLLGQSESGVYREASISLPVNAESAICRRKVYYPETRLEFQRLYTPTAFREERHLWRAVIQLNIVRSVRVIIETISDAHRSSVLSSDESDGDENSLFTQDLEFLTTRLLPLRHIESLLIAKLVPPNEDEATQLGPQRIDSAPGHTRRGGQEIFVRPGVGWHGALIKSHRNGRPMSAGSTGIETPDEPQTVLYSCRHDIIRLWNNANVRALLKRRKVRLEELPGFYLDDIERVTSPRYTPNEDDVLKARLKTVGVCEYSFELEVAAGAESGTEWKIIDVGGSRSQRQTWAQFFDDVDAILFLAPISGFDQALAEDRSVNRLEDSVLLWKSVCSNKLLANVELVLFLNKCDLLDAKLKSGIRLSKYVRSYGNRPNDVDTVAKYFRGKFSAIQREHSPKPRKFYGFSTSVTDTKTTAGILAIVRDVVIREHLKRSRLL